MRRIRLPLLIDLILADKSADVRSLAADPSLDRGFQTRGPLVNRMIARRIRSGMTIMGIPLPSIVERDDRERQQRQSELEEVFTAMAGKKGWDEESFNRIVAAIRADDSREIALATLSLVGKLFDPAFEGTKHTLYASQTIDRALKNRNPLLSIWWSMTGEVRHAKQKLKKVSSGDFAAIHAIGIAVHNLVESFERMADLLTHPSVASRISPEEAVVRVLVAPETVARQAHKPGPSLAGVLSPGSLVLMNTRAAQEANPSSRTAFLTDAWSICPAHQLVPALLMSVWTAATKPAGTEKEPSQ